MESYCTRIMICEEDPMISVWLSDAFRKACYEVSCVYSCDEVYESISNRSIDACIIDEKVFGNTGLDVVKELRDNDIEQPVIVMLDSGSADHIIDAYKAGCSDCIVKPFSVDIILYKTQALLNLVNKKERDTRTDFRLGRLYYDGVSQMLGNRKLTVRENEVLLLLCRNENKFVSVPYIVKHLWGRNDRFSTRSFYVYVCNLRKYLKDEGIEIIAGRRSGYKLYTEKACLKSQEQTDAIKSLD